MSEMKSRIMNEDVVEEILTYIEFRQLFQMQRISKQFCFCVESLLRRKLSLNFMNCNPRQSSVESILCEDSKHKSYYQLNAKNTVFICSQNIIPIVRKCPNIRCLYLNHDLGLETIQSMAQICERLQCLCFGKTFLYSDWFRLKRFGVLFAKRLVHLSIECKFQNESNDREVFEFIRYFTSIQNFKISHFYPMNQILNIVPKNLKSLYISCPPESPRSLEGNDRTSLMSYITENKRCLESLFFIDYHISEELFVFICSHLDLKQLSINCELLSLISLIRILCKSQPNLSKLTLIGLRFENIGLDSHRYYLKIRSLRLNWCYFDVISFMEILKLFQFLEKLDFNRVYFKCECNPTERDILCEECNQKCLTELSKSKTLKVLAINVGFTNLSSIWRSLTRTPNLQKLKVFSLSRDDYKELAQNLVEVLSEKTTKYFTLEFSTPLKKYAFVEELNHLCHEMPRNLRIIC